VTVSGCDDVVSLKQDIQTYVSSFKGESGVRPGGKGKGGFGRGKGGKGVHNFDRNKGGGKGDGKDAFTKKDNREKDKSKFTMELDCFPPKYPFRGLKEEMLNARRAHCRKIDIAQSKLTRLQEAGRSADEEEYLMQESEMDAVEAELLQLQEQLNVYENVVGKIIKQAIVEKFGFDNISKVNNGTKSKSGAVIKPRNAFADRLGRETYRLKSALPALALRASIELSYEDDANQFVVIQGATGSGKSTQLPQYLSEMIGPTKKVICTQVKVQL
jgi:hypothetical protein